MSDKYSLDHYDFDLPENLIAKYPCEKRTQSRLLVSSSKATEHKTFSDLMDFLKAGDTLVLNNTKVFPARLWAKKKSGGKAEVLLSRKITDQKWICLTNTKGKNLLGKQLLFEDGGKAEYVATSKDEPGAYEIEFDFDPKAYAADHGEIPLPPYFGRACEEIDKKRYQTIYAQKDKAYAVAAPTAGLHFDENLLQKIQAIGVNIAHVTLHVGPGTFMPIYESDFRKHQMHAEWWQVDETTANTLNRTRAKEHRIFATGTTSARTLETNMVNGVFKAGSGNTRIFIYPGYEFKAVDALITNFHLPKSTLMLMISAFVGRDRVMGAYRAAIDNKYRFFSYGDACLFLKD